LISSVIFDFDGVILDSVEVKTRAFAKLTEPFGEEAMHHMVRYHRENGGLSRFVKFEWFFQNVLQKKLSSAESEEWGRKFEFLVFEGVLKSEFIPGALEFLQEFHSSLPLFVASGTPEKELNAIIIQRNLNSFFRETAGSPRTKEEIVNGLLKKYSLYPSEVVFVGDAMSDYKAALACGLHFLGVAQPRLSPFPSGTRTIPDLRKLQRELSL
jgi:HAD superfamily hydrolase (TIGR01509 family)